MCSNAQTHTHIYIYYKHTHLHIFNEKVLVEACETKSFPSFRVAIKMCVKIIMSKMAQKSRNAVNFYEISNLYKKNTRIYSMTGY